MKPPSYCWAGVSNWAEIMSRLRLWSVIVTVVCVTFLTALDNNVVNVALPEMQARLGLSDTGVQWVATSYPMALAGSLLGAGQLTDARDGVGPCSPAWRCSRCRRRAAHCRARG